MKEIQNDSLRIINACKGCQYKNDELLNIYSQGAIKERMEVQKIVTTIDASLTTAWEKLAEDNTNQL